MLAQHAGALLAKLNDSIREMREAAVRTLGKLEAAGHLPELADVLRDARVRLEDGVEAEPAAYAGAGASEGAD